MQKIYRRENKKNSAGDILRKSGNGNREGRNNRETKWKFDGEAIR